MYGNYGSRTYKKHRNNRPTTGRQIENLEYQAATGQQQENNLRSTSDQAKPTLSNRFELNRCGAPLLDTFIKWKYRTLPRTSDRTQDH